MPAERPAKSKALCYDLITGIGGIGTGIFFLLEGDRTLGRNESRPARLLPVRDYCKLHIILHYVAVLLESNVTSGALRILPVGKVGSDQPGAQMRKEMSDVGMDMRFVETVPDRPTLMSVCFQYPDGSGGNITTTDSAASALSPEDIHRIEPVLDGVEGRILSLAGPEVSLEARRSLLELTGEYDACRILVVTSAEVARAKEMGIFSMADLLAINEDEAAAITGTSLDPDTPEAFLTALSRSLAPEAPKMDIIFTAGARGAYACADGQWDYCPAVEVEAIGTAGAGDALLAGTMCGLAGNLPFVSPGPPRAKITERALRSAFDLGVLLATFSITSPHTIHPEAAPKALLGFADRLGVRLSEQMKGLLQR